ncbi:SigE family RNA polymerase sigma factor [Hamadaea tsunoensis]|uniref:SigE family RNA polymerase sigma factor n=1 Tax=Hamadaea tsunoensis TaxID=53368 RepID=UPI000405450D|nr:SigE family RNA polymerase sigma factor [Hamadaea tsunoensis]
MRADVEREFVEYVTGRMPRLHRAAYLLCGDATRADDIVQATLVSLYAKWGRARGADNIEGYVHRILVRRFLDERRSAWARVVLSDSLPERPDPAGTPVEDRDAVVTALRGVPRGQRAVVVLRFLCDLSVEETAEALGCSTGNVKSQSARGLATLRELMGGVPVTAARVGKVEER